MTRRARLLSFGTAVAAIVLGAVLGPVLGGVTGEAVAISLASLGGIAIVALVFYEIGLSEDRERDAAARGRATLPSRTAVRLPRRRRRG
jgi:MFS family permease